MTRGCAVDSCFRDTWGGYALFAMPIPQGEGEVAEQWRCAEHHEGPMTKVLLPLAQAVEMAVNQESG